MPPARLSLDDVSNAIGQINQCTDEFSIHDILRKILPTLGAESYFYITLLNNEHLKGYKSHRFFIGCAPQFSQLYSHRKWFMVDPYIEYSRTNSAVVCDDHIPLRSRGQLDMRKAAADYGFKSLVVVPSHSGSLDRFGVLYLGSDSAPKRGNPLMMTNRILFRSIGMELLDWWALKIKAEMMSKFELTENEVALLKFHRNGYRARDVADELDISLKTVHNRMRILKEKFEVDSISAALRFAVSHGVLE